MKKPKGNAFAKILDQLVANNRATVEFKTKKFTAVLKNDMVKVDIELKMPLSVWISILAKLNPGV